MLSLTSHEQSLFYLKVLASWQVARELFLSRENSERVLVTGAAGFIGRHLVRALSREGFEVIALDKRRFDFKDTNVKFLTGDILRYDFDRLFRQEDVEGIFHLAGLLGTTELFHRIIEAEMVNVVGLLRVLEAMRRNDIDKVVFTSKPNVWKNNVYTITKENAERYLNMYREIYGIKTVITRPFNVYGPEEYLEEYRKAIPYFIVASLRNEPLEVFGTGMQTMDPIYVEDVVQALIRSYIMAPKDIVEIGSSKPVRVIDLAKKIIELTGSSSKVTYLPMRKGEPLDILNIRADGRMKSLIGYEPKVDLDTGLSTTIEWYREHLDVFSYYRYGEEDFVQHNQYTLYDLDEIEK